MEKETVPIHEKAALVAAIAVMMEKKPFKIKRFVPVQEEKFSSWKLAGRQDVMRRRMSMYE